MKFIDRLKRKPRRSSQEIVPGLSPSHQNLFTFRGQFPVYDPLPTWILVVIFIVLFILFLLAYASFYTFPKTLMKVDEPRYPSSFIAEIAFEHIRYLVDDVGYRVTGTPQNEELTVNYLIGVIRDIQSNAHPDVEITWSRDEHSGQFTKGTKKLAYVNVYRGVQNVVAKLAPRNVNANHSYILLNSHFDTVPMSPGAGDDATMVGVMLEILRVLSKYPRLAHPVVFLFNGCEENGLAGSHGFITQSSLMENVGVVINLEVSGAGGKELMFQAAPDHPWLMRAYFKAVKSAFANVAGEELYQNGFVQSDTDFTAFQKFGKELPAMDFAHSHACYSYHTKNDDMSLIRQGALQHTGNNIISLIEEFDRRPEPDEYVEAIDEKGRENVFYDFLGLFLIFYSQFFGAILNSVLFLVLTIIIGWCVYHIKSTQGIGFGTIFLEYLIAVTVQILSAMLGFVVIYTVAWIMDVCNRSMSYYSNLWILFGLYFCPFFFSNSILPYIYIKIKEKKGVISTSYYVQLANHAHCTLLVIVLAVLTILRIKSAYLVLLSTMFYFLSTLLNVFFNFINKGNKWLYLHCFGQIVPSIYYFYASILGLTTLVPIGGRAYDGGGTNPDVLAGFLVGIFSLLATGFYSPIIVMFKHRKIILGSFLAIFGVFIIIIMTPVGFPFRETTSPQRYTVWHTKREFYSHDGSLRKADAGYYVYGYDRHGARTILSEVPLMSRRQDMQEECRNEMVCGQPWYRIAYTGNKDYNYWIPAEDPKLPLTKPKLTLERSETLSTTDEKYYFTFAGPASMNLQISPLPGVSLESWSFLDETPEALLWNDRKVYFVMYTHGLGSYFWRDYAFDVTVRRSQNFSAPYSFDIALSAIFLDAEETKTPEFVDFTGSFPAWTNVQNWTAFYVSHQV